MQLIKGRQRIVIKINYVCGFTKSAELRLILFLKQRVSAFVQNILTGCSFKYSVPSLSFKWRNLPGPKLLVTSTIDWWIGEE